MTTTGAQASDSVWLQYLGCSAFVLTDAGGTSLALDLWTRGAFPYAEDTPGDLGLEDGPPLSMLLASHDHKDHSFVPPGVPVTYGVQSKKVADEAHLSRAGAFAIGRFSSKHYTTPAKRPKLNAVFLLEVAGMKLAHLGDAHGTMADESLLRDLKQRMGEVDLLMLPIGSPTMKPVDIHILEQVIQVMQPRASIPMHYWKMSDKAEVLSGLSHLGYGLVDLPGNAVRFALADLPQRGSKTIWNVPAGRCRFPESR